MTSPYLIADEIVRRMAFALRSLSAGCLESERERRGVYWDADVRADDMLQLDAEALKRERTRRRLFGIGVNIAAVAAISGRAAAGDMELINGSWIGEVGRDLAIVAVVLTAVAGFFVATWLLRNLAAALRPRRRGPLIERNAADDIWA